MSTISVIIPLYNSKGVLEVCLDSVALARDEFGDVEVIAIDNGSTDGSYELLHSRYGQTTRIYQLKQGSIAALRNFGARNAHGEYLLFLDSDCVIDKAYFHNLLEVFREMRADATGSKCEIPSAPSWCEETWQRLHRRSEDGYVNYLNSGNFVVRKSVFEKVGGFNEALKTDEDVELGERLRAAGFTIFECHALRAVHLRNAKTAGEFFRKEVWRGIGMAHKDRNWLRDRVMLMTIWHIVLTSVGVASLALRSVPLSWRIATLVICVLIAPALAVAYRFVSLRRAYRPLRSFLLYFLWLNAKAVALCMKAAGMH